jgi:hypothetical protein
MERVAGRIYSSALRRSSSPDREQRGGKVIMKGGSLWGPILATAFFILQMWP